MSHVAMNYLVSGRQQERMGTASPITCPWQTFKCADGRHHDRRRQRPAVRRRSAKFSASRRSRAIRASARTRCARRTARRSCRCSRRPAADALRTGVVRGVRSGRRPERPDLRLPAGVRGSADPAPRAADRDGPPAGGNRADGRQSDQVLRHAHRVPPAAAAAGRAHPGGPARGAPAGRAEIDAPRPARSDLTMSAADSIQAFRDSARDFLGRADQLKRRAQAARRESGIRAGRLAGDRRGRLALHPRSRGRRAASDWACAKLRRSPRRWAAACCPSRS